MGKGVGMPFIVSADGLGDDRFVICLCLRVLTEYVSPFNRGFCLLIFTVEMADYKFRP